MENKKLITVSATPHIRAQHTISSIMLDVIIALAPATLAGIYFFGSDALFRIIVSILSAVFFEYLYQKITKQEVTINDYSAILTGLLLALNLSSTIPFWAIIVGNLFSIIIVKQLFGGLGQNFLNPALAGRVFLTISYAAVANNYIPADTTIDTLTYATPLSAIKFEDFVPLLSDYKNVFWGNTGGSMGETSAFAIILGALHLIRKNIINWKNPLLLISAVAGFSMAFNLNNPDFHVLFELLSGGLLLGAFFMATDYSSSPITNVGNIIYVIMIGFIIAIIRAYGSYPEGVAYGILFMNLWVPILDRYTKPRVFGTTKGGKAIV